MIEYHNTPKDVAVARTSTTKKQNECLAFIQRYLAENDGVAPSYQNIADGLGLKSKSNVHRLVHGLVERGHLNVQSDRWRAMTIREARSLDAFSTDELRAEIARRAWEAQR